MHFTRSWIFFTAALFVLAFAPSARADAFYVTFTNAAGASTPRMLGAAVSISIPSQCTMEIDDWLGSATMLTSHTKLSATVEFASAPNGPVSLIAKLTDVAVTRWTGSLANGGVTEKIEFGYGAQNLSNPPGQTGPAHAVSTKAPTISRGVVAVAMAPAHIDDAYFAASGIAAEIGSGAHAGQTKISAFKMSISWLSVTNNGPPVCNTDNPKITMSTGPATQPLSNAEGGHTQHSVTLTFYQKSFGDIPRFTIHFPQVGVAGNAVSGKTENVLFGQPKKLKFTDATTGVSIELTSSASP